MALCEFYLRKVCVNAQSLTVTMMDASNVALRDEVKKLTAKGYVFVYSL